MSDFAKEIASSSIFSFIRVEVFYIELDESAVFFIFNVIEPVDYVVSVFLLIDINFL